MPGFSFTSTSSETVTTITIRLYDGGILALVISDQIIAAAQRIVARHNGARVPVRVAGVANEADRRSDEHGEEQGR